MSEPEHHSRREATPEMAYHGYAARPPRPPPPPYPNHGQRPPAVTSTTGYARAAAATNGYRTQPKDRPPVRRTTNGTQPRKQRRGQGSLERRREARAAARAAVASGSQLSANAGTFQPSFAPMPQEEPTSQWPGYRVICEQLGDEDPAESRVGRPNSTLDDASPTVTEPVGRARAPARGGCEGGRRA